MSRLRRTCFGVLASAVVIVPLALVGGSADAAVTAVRHLPGTTCTAFPADNWWHADVSKLPVDLALQDVALAHVADVEAAPGLRAVVRRAAVPYGIPITYVCGSHPKVSVRFHVLLRERPGGLPARDGHQDRGRPRLDRRPARDHRRQEHLPGSTRPGDDQASTGHWHAGSGAVWSLTSDRLRTDGLDLSRRRRAADPARAAALGRGRGRPGRPRDPVHHRRHVEAPHVAGAARRRVDHAAGVPADGRPVPAQGVATPRRVTPPRPRWSSRR